MTTRIPPTHPAAVVQPKRPFGDVVERPQHPAAVVQSKAPYDRTPERPPHAAQMTTTHASAPTLSGRILQPAQKEMTDQQFWKFHQKKKCGNWQIALQTYATYGLSKDKSDWIMIAKASGAGLPVDVGHGSGGAGDPDQHVQRYVDAYIKHIVRPHVGLKLKDAKREYNIA